MEVTLALGGGGIKGIAHLGVIKFLEEAGVKVRAIAGTSVGGLVGAVYAAGFQVDEIQKIVENMNSSRMYTRQPGDGPSLMGYTGLAETLTQVLGSYQFSDLKIPFACTAVDIQTSQEIYLNQGLVTDAVLATIALPGIFPPKKRGTAELVDGGVLDPVPVRLARQMEPTLPVIAVALNPAQEEWDRLPMFNITPFVPFPVPPPIMESFTRMRIGQAITIYVDAMDITCRMLTELRLKVDKPEVIVRPDVHEFGLIDKGDPKKLIKAGYLAAADALPEIKKSISWANSMLRILRSPYRPKIAEILNNGHESDHTPKNGKTQ